MPPRAPHAPTSRSQALTTLRIAGMPPRTGLAVVVAVVLGEAARRPVRLRGVAAARAVEGGDVLQRDQDVSVQLDVGDVLDEAVGGQDTVLIIAAEEGDFDLLTFVFVGVVLHLRPVYWRVRRRLDGRPDWRNLHRPGETAAAAKPPRPPSRHRKRRLIRRETAAERRLSGARPGRLPAARRSAPPGRAPRVG